MQLCRVQGGVCGIRNCYKVKGMGADNFGPTETFRFSPCCLWAGCWLVLTSFEGQAEGGGGMAAEIDGFLGLKVKQRHTLSTSFVGLGFEGLGSSGSRAFSLGVKVARVLEFIGTGAVECYKASWI